MIIQLWLNSVYMEEDFAVRVLQTNNPFVWRLILRKLSFQLEHIAWKILCVTCLFLHILVKCKFSENLPHMNIFTCTVLGNTDFHKLVRLWHPLVGKFTRICRHDMHNLNSNLTWQFLRFSYSAKFSCKYEIHWLC